MNPIPSSNFAHHRIGFHYYSDTRHYRQSDLETWLPPLVEMGASWLTLVAPAERAIPESFIQALLSARIQPILHFCLKAAEPIPLDSLRLLLNAYARWGVGYVSFFDRPNVRSSWPAYIWAQNYLVERLLDDFIPLARAAQEQDLTVITPPLEPGGDYWDLAFLRTALRGLKRRGCTDMLDSLAIGAYAWINNRPVDWGVGGPERWPEVRPYQRPNSQQDHLGFHIFDWYLAICQEELGCRLPVFLLRAGQRFADEQPSGQAQAGLLNHARKNLSAVQRITSDPSSDHGGEVLPDEVKACNFWLLAADPDDPQAGEAWFLPSGEHLPVVEAFRQWAAYLRQAQDPGEPVEAGDRSGSEVADDEVAGEDNLDPDLPASDDELGEDGTVSELSEPIDPGNQIVGPKNQITHPINHYVLLPLYAWGAANWELSMVEALLQETHPAIGFSLAEARLAKRVTVVGADGAISSEALAMLRKSGCQVERLLEDGTLIAT
jgi:hypothetical protein